MQICRCIIVNFVKIDEYFFDIKKKFLFGGGIQKCKLLNFSKNVFLLQVPCLFNSNKYF